ncbi:MAG: PKD domain-containing protein [Bacteroidia bacterium]|nr:PKD domain-containing protein [Bacteroidia bacterium]
MKYIFTFLIAVLMSVVLFAQNNTTSTKRKCGFEEVQKWRLQNEPGYAEVYQKLQDFTNKFVADHPNGYSPKAVITIPVVFHIVLSTAQQATFADLRCTEQIAVMNQDYAGLNTHSMGPFAASLKTNTDLQFCLATISPTGAATNGIERRDWAGAPWGTSSDVKHFATGGLDSWPTTDYLNIWVCDLGGGLCGYALTPGGAATNPEYGLVNHYEYTGVTGASPPYNLGGTGTHESGHCFDLKHTWGDAGGCSPDDLVADTPPQDIETYGNPTPPLLDACSGTAPGIMYMNFMDYVDDIAYANFTPGQKTRIQACFAPGGPLEQLGQSAKCGVPLVADFVGVPCVPLTVNIGGLVDFTDLTTGNPTAWQWTFTGAGAGPGPLTSTIQNPQNIQYNTVGLFPVKLKVTKPNFADSITKIAYIEVIDPAAVNCDFVGNPTVILSGNTVDFTDLSTNVPTSWQWTFDGGVPNTSTVKNPQNILYSTPGIYNVWHRAANAATNDTLTKLGYIKVIDPADIPHADFMADFTIRPVGSNINFTNLSTGIYDSLHWYFSGAVPTNSVVNNPALVNYPVIGDFDVTLILFSGYGNDTLTKQLYIHIFDPAIADTVHANFHATTGRLIVQGGAVSFEDLSIGNITGWQWTFQGGTPATSTTQNPQNIVYSTPGIYDVCLIVSNATFRDTLCKTDYVVVTTETWPDPNGFCDTVSNIYQGEHPLTFMHLTPQHWGYFPGHNQLLYKYYADKVTNYTFTDVTGLVVPVVKAYSASPNNKVRFTVWDVNSQGLPGNRIGYKDELISSFTPYLYHPVHFTTPIPVNGEFFVGFELFYNSPADTFVVYMAPNRGITGTNNLYLRKTTASAWKTPTEFFNDTMLVNTTLAIQIQGCLVGIEEIDMDNQISIYPNPAYDKLNIELIDVITNSFDCKVYDLTGRSIGVEPFETNSNHYEIDLSRFNSGIYLLELNVNNQKVTKKISVIK